MRIGQIEIPQLCRLAPMAATSNAPFRLIAKECGSGLTTTEEMDAFALLMNTPRAGDMAAYYPQERPLAMQFLGRDPQALIRAALRCEDLSADIVDLNMSCPMPKITGLMKAKGLIDFRLYEWADELRLAGNEADHEVGATVSREDASDMLDFTKAILDYLFSYRDKFERFKHPRQHCQSRNAESQ